MWGQWTSWAVCTKTCGGGVTARVRNISVEASNGGEECIGEKKETKECQTQQCPDRKLQCELSLRADQLMTKI